MRIIGLTGGIGAGKSTVSGYLKMKGCTIIDADEISHQITAPQSPALQKLADAFGRDILEQDGSLRRKKLADIVFSDKEKLTLLESITTREVVEVIGERLQLLRKEGHKGLVFVDAPLLFETGTDKMTDAVFLVDADLEVRISRVTERDQVSRQQVLARMNSQMSTAEKAERATEIIDNSKGKEELYRQVDALLEKYAETE